MSIILDNVSYVYGQNEGYIKQALKDINLVIGKNEFIGLIGCLLYTSPSPRD